jgi:alpha-L-fucosidase 2
LMAVYPLDEITPWETPAFAKAAAVTLERRKKSGIGWVWAWRMALCARLQNGNEALRFLRSFLTPSNASEIDYNRGAGTYPNLFCAGPPFQIDGNLGAVAGIAEMLLQSHGKNNIIRLLPALPADTSLQSGSVKGLRARQRFEVSFSWRQGQVQKLRIRSTNGLPCHILLPGLFTIKNSSGKAVSYKKDAKDVIEFATNKGTDYLLFIHPKTKGKA